MKDWGPFPDQKRLERQPDTIHNPFAIKDIIGDIGEAWMQSLAEEYIGVCYIIFTTFWKLETISKYKFQTKCTRITEEYRSGEDSDNSQFATMQSESWEAAGVSWNCQWWSQLLPEMSRFKTKHTKPVAKFQMWKFTHLSTTARAAITWLLTVLFLPNLLRFSLEELTWNTAGKGFWEM